MIWLGDFNYRIGLANQTVRDLVFHGDLQKLYDNDQVFANGRENLDEFIGLTHE